MWICQYGGAIDKERNCCLWIEVCWDFRRFCCGEPNLNAIVDINKSKSGTETCVLGENSVTELDARKAAAMLKLKMRRG